MRLLAGAGDSGRTVEELPEPLRVWSGLSLEPSRGIKTWIKTHIADPENPTMSLKNLLASKLVGAVHTESLNGLISVANHELFRRRGYIDRELPDYYAFTTAFMLGMLAQNGRKPENEVILSVGCRVDHLLNFTVSFKRVIHISMMEMEGAEDVLAVLNKRNFRQIVGDVFAIDAHALAAGGGCGDADIVLSHATVHCLSDTRYGNSALSASDRWGGG
jgi:hypothetical protein